MNDTEFVKEPEKLKLDHKTPYLLYNPTAHGHFNARQLTIYAVGGMIKHLATLDELREAHDLMGRIKTVKIPHQNRAAEDDYRERFLSVKWDELGTFPTTWSLRFNLVAGQTPHLANPKDISMQGHSIDQLAGDQTKSSQYRVSRILAVPCTVLGYGCRALGLGRLLILDYASWGILDIHVDIAYLVLHFKSMHLKSLCVRSNVRT